MYVNLKHKLSAQTNTITQASLQAFITTGYITAYTYITASTSSLCILIHDHCTTLLTTLTLLHCTHTHDIIAVVHVLIMSSLVRNDHYTNPQ